MSPRKLILFGDSIAAGLGVRELRYAELLAKRIGFDLIDEAVSGATVAESFERFQRSPRRAEVAIIAHGVTEPIHRPTSAALRFFPARWRRRGWMDPRPYYSTRLRKRSLEILESALRWRMKNISMCWAGSEQLMTKPAYRASVEQLIGALQACGTRVIIMGPTHIDGRYFPGSDLSQMEYFREVSNLGAIVVDPRRRLHMWSDYFADRFHPNHSGHAKIAELLTDVIQTEGWHDCSHAT